MERNRNSDGYLLWVALCVGALLGLLIMTGGCHTNAGVGQNLTDTPADYVK